ncbi:MAG: magnesium/cobalt transporter CorA, partial [Bdellovibrionales bacterium]|nr:magnesium/cobalt transporter CorA [Bdellovibrionales bacterium]
WVLTFQEWPGDVFDPIRARIRAGKGLIRKGGSDYLAAALIDAVVDGYYPVFEAIGDSLEDLELEVVRQPNEQTLERIYQAKRDLLNLRRAVWPQREVLNELTRSEHRLIKKQTRLYFRDAYDHAAQLIDVLETFRELAGSFMDVYLSSISMRMNEVMKVLTIIATIFIPLSFLAGVYGMNFEYMPELRWRWAYPAFWMLMLILAGLMLLWFRRLGWLGGDRGPSADHDRVDSTEPEAS